MRNSKCLRCGTEMRVRRENKKYDASGLDNVTLVNVAVWHCPECGEEEVAIPRIEELHRTLSGTIAMKKERLTPREVRFLRSYLGLSGVDFARRMGVSKEAASRWERVDKPLRMKTATERFLRLMVLHEGRGEHYAIAELDRTATEASGEARLKLTPGKAGWRSEVEHLRGSRLRKAG